MSRRTAGGATAQEVERLTLEDDNDNNDDIELADVHEHWKRSAFAAGCVPLSWKDDDLPAHQDHQRDTTGCLCTSRLLCRNAGRVGNMVVLRQGNEWVEAGTEVDGKMTILRRYQRPVLLCVLGPYWPMLLFVTYPLILLVSGYTWWHAIGRHPFVIQAGFYFFTIALLVALALTGCRDPGIAYRTAEPLDDTWRWSDAAQSYRPRYAYYDCDTAVVVQGFDHTCPWTGTAIGRNNMLSFQIFVCLIFVCMIMDIMLITDAL